MRILRGHLPCMMIVCLALWGCQTEECKNKICTNEPTKPTDQLTASIRISSPLGWDSVSVELHSGSTVERGRLLQRWSLTGGQFPSGVAVGEGDYSAKATYMRTGDTLEVYDSDDASWDSNEDECGCVTGWSRTSAELELYAN